MTDYLNVAITVALLIVSSMFHEVAHAATAYACGDPTAHDAGRITLNPFVHLHPVGSILLPLAMVLAGGPVFAFANPVPYDPRRLRHPRRDEALVALAGPASNALQALVGTGLFYLIDFAYTNGALQLGVAQPLAQIATTYIVVNLSLMFFNLIPLPPLDGSKLILPFLSDSARQGYYRVQYYAMPVFLGVLYLLPMVTGYNPVGTFLHTAVYGTLNFLLGA